MRPDRVLAIARRDLAQELRGRGGWVLPAIMAGLMLPVSGAPRVRLPPPAPPPPLAVSGDVPAAVTALPNVLRAEGGLVFRREPGQLVVAGEWIRDDVRAALDGEGAAVRLVASPRRLPLPGRSMLFALLSASTLTAAVSASLAGERSARTLVTLLAAAVTRGEIVAGKWLAWGGLGAVTALLAALVAVALGRIDGGWWLLPMASVPLGTVALGLFLVRRAGDVIGGTTVSLRVLPAVLGVSGLVAWFLGASSPLLSALVPLGGALIAAGGTWGTDPGPPLLATTTTLGFSAALLQRTAAELDEDTDSGKGPTPLALAVWTVLLAAPCWLVPVLGPLAWTFAGNPRITEQLSAEAGIAAGACCLLLMSAVRAARVATPARDLGLVAPPSGAWIFGSVVAGALLAALGPWSSLPAPGQGPAALRLADALVPLGVGLGPAVLSIVADELLFRGWLLRASGSRASAVAWWLVKIPTDPVTGLVSGGVLALVGSRGGAMAAIVARGSWLAAAWVAGGG